MRKKYYVFTFFWILSSLLLSSGLVAQSTLSATYTEGDIPVNYNEYSETCNGPLTTLSIQLPAEGGPWEVTSIDIAYNMTGVGWVSDQRSAIYCENSNTGEDWQTNTVNQGNQTYEYDREDINIANGYYANGTELIFEMRAWHTWDGHPDCSTEAQKVDDGTWTITVHYQEQPSCLSVSDVVVENTGFGQVEVSWTDPEPATAWNIEYGPQGFELGTGTTVAADSNPFVIDEISGGTFYDFYVQTNCGGDDFSDWSEVTTVAVDVPTETYAGGDIPTTEDAHEETCNGPDTTISLTLPPGGPYEVTGFDVVYDMTAQNGAYKSEQRSQIYLQNLEIAEPQWYSGSGTGGTQHYDRTNVNIANGYYDGETELIFEMRAWRTWSSFGQGGCTPYNSKVDDGTWSITLYYQEAPSCIPPQSITAEEITAFQADITWEEVGEVAEWSLEYGETGFTQGEGTMETDLTAQTFQITDLNPETEYDVYIQSNCGEGDNSNWTGPYTFETLVACNIPEDLQLESTTLESTTFSWTGSPDETNGYNWYVMEADSGNPDTGTVISNGVTNPEATQVIIEGLALDTAYDFYLQANCGETNGQSVWVGPIDFVTPIIGVTIEATGYNADVIANGVGPMEGSTNNDVDGVNYCFVSEDWKLNEEDADISVGLPSEGLVTSSSINGLSYQINSYDENNSLRITTDDVEGTLTLNNPDSYLSLYFLVTSGSGSSTIDAEVNFTDMTSQTYSSLSISDWFGGNPFEISGFGRGNLDNNGLETPNGNPRLYRLTLDIDEANQSKPVESITFTNNGNGVLNIFAISGKLATLCAVPSNLTLDNATTNTAEISWNSALGETNGYDWMLMLSGENPDVDSPVDNGTIATEETNVTLSDLEPGTVYDFYLKTNCEEEGSNWTVLSFQTAFSCPTPENIQLNNIDNTNANISWEPSIAESGGYSWALMLSGEDPDEDAPIGNGTTATEETSVDLSDLSPQTSYDFYVRANCDTLESNWVMLNFETLPDCPAPSNIQVFNITPLTADLSWDASFAETGGYNWILMLSGENPETDTPVSEGTNASMETTVSLSELNPETTYDFYVQTICGTEEVSLWSEALSFATEEVDYCNPSYTNTDSTHRISEVSVPEASFTAALSSASVSDYTDQVIAIEAGVSYTFDVTTLGWVGIAIAADFNYNGDFEDMGELLLEPQYISTSPATYEFPIVIPAETPPGNYRIRIWNIGANSGDGTPAQSPCGAYAYGNFTDFTLSVASFDCESLEAPQGESEQEFIEGHTLNDLEIETADMSSITWYEDQELTIEIDPSTNLEDNTTYYVTQSLADCESEALAITATEFVCIATEVPTTNGETICGSGTVTLTATDVTEDYVVYWYDAETDGNMIGEGPSIDVEVSETTSYWAVQVFIVDEEEWCRSNAVETIAEVLITPVPAGENNQILCGGTLSDLEVTGENLTWYTEEGDELNSDTELIDGETYSVTQTLDDCESGSLEITVTVTQPETPSGENNQSFCEGIHTLADLDVTGENLTWYTEEGNQLNPDTEVEDGETYIVTQTLNDCESDSIEITVTIVPKSAVPNGDTDQNFVQGDTIGDLDVTGENLTWYADAEGTVEISTDTELEHLTTYYVSQIIDGECESELLAVTAHEILGVNDKVFSQLSYYPNPVKHTLNIKNVQLIENITLYNVHGQKVLFENVNSTTIKLDMAQYSSGVYFFKVISGGKEAVYRIVKE